MMNGPSGERVNARGAATRLRILLVAERLFAERGVFALPLRDIGIEAGQKNHTAVQYHFGDREALLREIINYRLAATEERRSEFVADMMTSARQPQVADIMRAYVLPLAVHLEHDNHYLAFMSRYIIERGGYTGGEVVDTMPTVKTFRSLLTRLLPHLPDAVLDERWMLVLTSTIHALARYQTALLLGKLPSPVEKLLEDLVDFLAAGLQAHASPTADPAPAMALEIPPGRST